MATHGAVKGLACLCLIVLVPISSDAQCMNFTMCYGCGTPHVSCSSARLTAFPTFSDDVQAHQVEALDLQVNLLLSISASDLEDFTALLELDFSNNRISRIEEGSFSTNMELTELNLEQNQLTELPDHLFNTTKLSVLNLQCNAIERISAATFDGVVDSSTILLNNNNITTIPNGTFSALQSPRQISLASNPLHCDCELQWFPEFLSSLEPGTTVDAGTCHTPADMRGLALDSMNQTQFICECSPDCVNGSCNLLSGTCECNAGYTGETCSIECPLGFYGQNCEEECECQNGAECDIVTGNCTCIVGYYGFNCDHDCSRAPDCSSLGREPCSLSTPEQTCGPCLMGQMTEPGNTFCSISSMRTQHTALTTATVISTSSVQPEAKPEATSTPSRSETKHIEIKFIIIITCAVLVVSFFVIVVIATLPFILCWRNSCSSRRNKVRPSTEDDLPSVSTSTQ